MAQSPPPSPTAQKGSQNGVLHSVVVQNTTPAPPAQYSQTPPPTLATLKDLKYRVLHSFVAQSPGEISITVGDVITIIQMHNSGWWEARTAAGKGWVPSSHLKEELPNLSHSRTSQYRALHDFAAQYASQLTINKDDVFAILQKDASGWWLARTATGQQGWIPSNYLKEETPALPSTAPVQEPTPNLARSSPRNSVQAPPAQAIQIRPPKHALLGPSAMQLPPNKQRKLTYLAEKYTHPPGPKHQILITDDWLKSGLTPITPGPFTTSKEQADHDALEAYQRSRFFGFSIAELHDIEAVGYLSKDSVRPSLDNIPVHFLWRRSQWVAPNEKHIHRWPIRKRGSWYWEGSNDRVWHAMKPALQLASLFMKKSELWGFWDGLFYGKYTRIPNYYLPPEFQIANLIYKVFQLRDPSVFRDRDEVAKMGNNMLWLADHVEFSIFSGYATYSGMPQIGFCYGLTQGMGDSTNRKIHVSFAYELIEPLMRSDSEYTYAERTMDHYRLASTILHETTHAMWMLIKQRWNHRLQGEPYFENESIQELGYAVEKALFGCLCHEVFHPCFPTTDKGLPAGGLVGVHWPRVTKAEYDEQFPVLLNPPVEWMQQDYMPIPLHYFKNLHDENFWNVYTKVHGPESTHVGPRLVAIRVYYSEAPNISIIPPIRIFPLDALSEDQLMPEASRPLETRLFIDLENERRRLGSRIRLAVSNRILSGGFPLRVPEMQTSPALPESTSPDPAIPPEKILRRKCPRYDEIRKFLVRRRVRRDLALDTMNFVMPEHTMLGSIVSHGGLQPELQAEEWRNFLIIAHHIPDLFSYDTNYPGYIKRISNGWPTIGPRPRVKPAGEPPSQRAINCFRLCAEHLERTSSVFDDGFLDHDAAEYRFLINKIFTTRPGVRVAPELPGSGFEKDVFDRLVWDCHTKGELLTYGPTGTVRKLLPGFVPAIYTKRKRDAVSDTCRLS